MAGFSDTNKLQSALKAYILFLSTLSQMINKWYPVSGSLKQIYSLGGIGFGSWRKKVKTQEHEIAEVSMKVSVFVLSTCYMKHATGHLLQCSALE